MNGYSVNRYNIESKKTHKSNQRGHLTLKYRRDSNINKTISIKDIANKDNFNVNIKEISNNDDQLNDLDLKSEFSISAPDDNSRNIRNDDSKDENDKVNNEDDSEDELIMEKEDNLEELDDDEELLLELEKIRKERAEKTRENMNNEIRLKLKNNPLLEEDGFDKGININDYVLKKRWTEDTVFKNKYKIKEKKKRFINDILHSDRHKEFMKKYIL